MAPVAFRNFLTPVGLIPRKGANRNDFPWQQYIARPAKGETLEQMRRFEFWEIPQPALWIDVYPVDGSFPPVRFEFIAGELVSEEPAPEITAGLLMPGGVRLPIANVQSAPTSQTAQVGQGV